MNSSRGRPRGGGDARERLVSAARLMFAEQGYRAVSARAIAREAGVDHALVNYYFGSKRGLFAAVMELEFNPGAAIEEVLARSAGASGLQVAEALLGVMLAVWEPAPMQSVMRDMIDTRMLDGQMRAVIGDFIGTEVLTQLADHIGGVDASRRAAGVSAIISGLVFARYILRIEPMASMAPRDVIRTLAPSMAVHLR